MSQLNMFPEQQTKVHNILDTWSNILDEEDINCALKIFSRVEKLRNTNTVTIYPDSDDVFKVFERITPSKAKVVILGQDPYHDGNATGAAFACKKTFTPSFKQIWNSIKNDTEKEYQGKIKIDASLEHLLDQGVLLLNSLLTVQEKQPLSHKYFNWETFTCRVIQHLSRTKKNLVFMLWGTYANKYKRYINENDHLILEYIHPVYATYKGEDWNCTHFSECNKFLLSKNIEPIKWR